MITDLRFSGPSGNGGARASCARRGRTTPDAPVVVMTGYGSPEAEAEARRLGVDAFVPKPVPLWELARLVQGWAALRGVLRRTPLDPRSLARVIRRSQPVALRSAGGTTKSGASSRAFALRAGTSVSRIAFHSATSASSSLLQLRVDVAHALGRAAVAVARPAE